MIPLGLLTLASIYLLAMFALRSRAPGHRFALVTPERLTLAIAFLAAAGAFLTLMFLTNWRGATEIAWVGLRSMQPAANLVVGGSGTDAVTGWPNGARAPLIQLSPAGGFTIARGGGFVRDGDNRYLNGEAFDLSRKTTINGFDVHLVSSWWWWRRVEIRGPNGDPLASIRVRRGRRDRVLDMETATQDAVIALRSSGAAATALELERWAFSLRLLIPALGDGFRMLDPGREYRGHAALPADWTIAWTSVSLKVRVRAVDGRVLLEFQPPWRAASPLPPLKNAGVPKVTLTARPLPGDHAFVAPLGSALRDLRADLPITGGRFTQCLEQAATSPFAPRLSSLASGWEAVTCTREIEAPTVAFRLATVQDLPRWSYVAATLVVPLCLLAWALWLCLERSRPDDRWIIGGLVSTVWLLLIYRWLLALRYAGDPTYLDEHAIKGVTSAAVALALVPVLLLAVARIWRDQFIDFKADGTLNRVLRHFMVLASVTAMVYLVQPSIVRALWPNMPVPPWSFKSAFGAITSAIAALAPIVITAAALLLFILFLVFEYGFIEWPSARKQRPSRPLVFLRFVATFGWWMWSNALHNVGTVWESLLPRRAEQVSIRGRYAAGARSPSFFWRYVVPGYIAFGIVLVVLRLLAAIPGGTKVVQEVLAPAILCWLPVCILLGARHVFPPGDPTRLSVLRALWIVPPLVFGSVFLFPMAVDDVGGIVATVSVFLPLSMLLLAGGRPWTLSVWPLATLSVTFLLAATLYMTTEVKGGPGMMGQAAKARVLLWRNGAAGSQDALLWANVRRDGQASLPVHYRRLSDAIEHVVENRLMAHEGSWFGLGFGEAPTRLSRIRQDTLQYDSTFSFFVMGDSGLIGGLALSLLYAVPLVLVLVSGRPLFDAGHAFAAIVASALWLAALAHAAMNLGVLPFTGRNLPLLSVNSNTDLMLWTMLLGVAVQALLWRVSGHDRVWADPASVISSSRTNDREPAEPFWRVSTFLLTPPLVLLLATMFAGAGAIIDRDLDEGFDWSETLRAVNGLIRNKVITFDSATHRINRPADIPIDTVIGQEIELFNSLPLDERLEGTFPHGPSDFRARLRRVRNLRDYDALMRELRALDDGTTVRRRPSLFDVDEPDEFADEAGTLRYLNPEYRLSANAAYNTRVNFDVRRDEASFPHVGLSDRASGVFLLRARGVEIAIPRHGGTGARTVTLTGDASGLRVLSDQNPGAATVRIVLRIAPDRRAAMQSYALMRAEATANGLMVRAEDLDLQLRAGGGMAARRLARSVDVAVQPSDVVELPGPLRANLQPSFAIDESAHGALVGPAWVRGTYRLAYNPDPLIPWTGHLADALLSKAMTGVLANGANAPTGTLTLDRGLQVAAQQFAAARGRLRHGQLLTARGARDALPPRVALAVVSLPSGGVLAMGGWPRVQSGSGWLSSDAGDIPSARWAEERAPKQLRRRYGGDRNFDRMLMGSATKPIFASAVLAVHGDLDRRMAVTGSEGEEKAVFGIELPGPTWEVGSSGALNGQGRWADFRSYLARSDNRYHIRLGFAGLAEPDPAQTLLAIGGTVSPSTFESMDGGANEWRRYPAFPATIEFSHRQPGRFSNIADTPLADRLSAMFGIGIRGDDRLPGYSFWTGNDSDDRPAPAGTTRPSRMPLSIISPEAPQFALHRLDRARGYVSLLLGGEDNMWANVDFAAAFAAAVSGQPIVPHIMTETTTTTTRVEFPDIAARLRPGLEAVVDRGGTAHEGLRLSGALAWLAQLRAAGYHVYAKTGTLALADDQPATSRLVLAIVRWNANGAGIERGAVFSLVIERGQTGLAAHWLGDFLAQHAAAIERIIRQ